MTLAQRTKPFDEQVGLAVKTLRVLRGLSQSELGEKLGLSFQQIQKYETGRNRIAISTLHLIAQALDAEIPDFLPSGPMPTDSEYLPRALRLAKRIDALPEQRQEAVRTMLRLMEQMD